MIAFSTAEIDAGAVAVAVIGFLGMVVTAWAGIQAARISSATRRETKERGDDIHGLLESLLAGQADQDRRHARSEASQHRILTRLGRIEARQRTDHERLTSLEGDAA